MEVSDLQEQRNSIKLRQVKTMVSPTLWYVERNCTQAGPPLPGMWKGTPPDNHPVSVLWLAWSSMVMMTYTTIDRSQ